MSRANSAAVGKLRSGSNPKRRGPATFRVTRVAVVAVLVALSAVRAAASEESQALSARAAVELAAGRTAEGMALLDRAVAADSFDAAVRYQRGVERAKARNFETAIEDLRAAVAYRPDFPAAQLELGAALVETGRSEEAIAPLLKAQEVPALEGSASYFLGVAYLRLNQMDDARRNLDRALARDPSLAVAVQYYRGVIAYRRGDFAAAEEQFRAVEREAPTSALGLEASQFIDVIERTRPTGYRLFARTALEYDSNVALAPDTTLPGAESEEGDGRFVVNAGGTFVPWSNHTAGLSLGYEFFQSLHFDLHEFNLQDHRPTVQLTAEHGAFSGGLLGRYDYYFLTDDSFMQEGTVFPWGSMEQEGFGHTDVYYRMQRRDYKQLEFQVLNGFYHETGARQFVELGNPTREAWVGYQFEASVLFDGGQDEYQYDAHQVEVGLRWLMPYAVTFETGYRYAHKDYDSASGNAFRPAPGRRRRDHDQRVVAAFERPLSEISPHLFVTASYFGTFNESNKDDFEYDRHIGSLGVEVRL